MDGDTRQWEESGCDFGLGLTRPRDSVHFLSPQPTFLLMTMVHFLSVFEHFRTQGLADN